MEEAERPRPDIIQTYHMISQQAMEDGVTLGAHMERGGLRIAHCAFLVALDHVLRFCMLSRTAHRVSEGLAGLPLPRLNV